MAKTFPIENFNGGLTLSKNKGFAFTCVTFNNGTKTQTKAAEGAKLIYILSGEMDIIIENKVFRLKPRNWINIPKGKHYSVNVYRSLEECRFMILTCLQGSIENKVMFGDLYELPLKKSSAEYSLFGQESEVMQGTRLIFENDASWTDKCANESFVYAMDGEIKVKNMFMEFTVPSGSIAFIPKKFKFTITASTHAEVLLVTSPVNTLKANEYTDWLKSKYGLLWNEGAIEI